jgi:hypothetical protein
MLDLSCAVERKSQRGGADRVPVIMTISVERCACAGGDKHAFIPQQKLPSAHKFRIDDDPFARREPCGGNS